MSSSARVSLLAALAAGLVPQSFAASGFYGFGSGAPTIYVLTVTGNALVGRTRKPMMMYKNVEYRVQGLVHEVIGPSAPAAELPLKLNYENKSVVAKLGGLETGLFEYLARPFLPDKNDGIEMILGEKGGVLAMSPSKAGPTAMIAAGFLEACLRPPLPPRGLASGSTWKVRIPSQAGAVAALEGFSMTLNLKALSASGGWWEFEESTGVLKVLVQDGGEGTPAEFSATGRVRLAPGLLPRWAKFSTVLTRKGPEAAPPEKCDILVEVKQS